MPLTQSKHAKGNVGVPYPAAVGVVTTAIFSYTFLATMAAADILELGCLPANCVPVDAILVMPDVDSNGAPAVVLDLGLMSGDFGDNDAARTCGDEFYDGITTGQAGGVLRSTEADAFGVTANVAPRGVGLKCMTAAATADWVGKTVKLVLSYIEE